MILFQLHVSQGYKQRKYNFLSDITAVSKNYTTLHQRIAKTSRYGSETLAPLE